MSELEGGGVTALEYNLVSSATTQNPILPMVSKEGTKTHPKHKQPTKCVVYFCVACVSMILILLLLLENVSERHGRNHVLHYLGHHGWQQKYGKVYRNLES